MQPPLLAERVQHRAVKVVIVRKLHVAADIPGETVVVRKAAGEPARVRVGLDHHKVGMTEFFQAVSRADPGRTGSDNHYTTCIVFWHLNSKSIMSHDFGRRNISVGRGCRIERPQYTGGNARKDHVPFEGPGHDGRRPDLDAVPKRYATNDPAVETAVHVITDAWHSGFGCAHQNTLCKGEIATDDRLAVDQYS